MKKLKSRSEAFGVSVAVTMCFAVFLLLVILISNAIFSVEDLRLENALERAYNGVIISIQSGSAPSDKVMEERNILGFGYYTHSGTALFTWGDAYLRLPITTFPNINSESLTVSSYDKATGKMECVRYTSGIEINRDSMLFRGSGRNILRFPDVIYLAYDASSYMGRKGRTMFFSFVAVVATVLAYAGVLFVMRQNAVYKKTLEEQKKFVSLGHAARTLTHEIKNPLSAIEISSAILKRTAPEALFDDISVIDRETERIKNLTDRVSDFLKNPRGRPEKINLVKFTENIISVFPSGVVMAGGVENAYVAFDRDRLRSVLENLIKNAIEASDGTDVVIGIKKSGKAFWSVSVSDRGSGIDEKDIDRIFDPFYTTKSGGSGIGLSISREFVVAAGGSISVLSRQGGGTIVNVLIPSYDRKGRSK